MIDQNICQKVYSRRQQWLKIVSSLLLLFLVLYPSLFGSREARAAYTNVSDDGPQIALVHQSSTGQEAASHKNVIDCLADLVTNVFGLSDATFLISYFTRVNWSKEQLRQKIIEQIHTHLPTLENDAQEATEALQEAKTKIFNALQLLKNAKNAKDRAKAMQLITEVKAMPQLKALLADLDSLEGLKGPFNLLMRSSGKQKILATIFILGATGPLAICLYQQVAIGLNDIKAAKDQGMPDDDALAYGLRGLNDDSSTNDMLALDDPNSDNLDLASLYLNDPGSPDDSIGNLFVDGQLATG